jgi:protein-S-isoprenylcysteine O-methyltransferase Ste14
VALAKHVIGGCWIAFVLYWALNARSLKPSAEGQSWLGILLHRTPTLLGGLLLLWPCLRPPLELNLFPRTSAAGWLGVALCALGLLAAIWSRQTLGANWSSIVVFRAGHELVQTGPYRFVRHPIYSSVLLMCLGSAVAIDRLGSWLGLPLLFAGFWIKLRQEEALLTRHFPVEYPAYQARAKALIPRLL